MTETSHHRSWLPTLVLIVVISLGLWLTRGPLEKRRELAEIDSSHPGYFLSYPGTKAIETSLAFVQSKSVAADRHVSPLEVRVFLERFAQGKEKIDVEALNKALDERWPMK